MQDIVASNKDYSGLLQPHDDYFTLQHYAGKVSLKTSSDNPEATSRDDAIFSGERHFWLKSPWAPFLTKRVPKVVEIRPAD